MGEISMGKVIKSSQIKEIALNPSYYTKEELESLINEGLPVRWINADEEGDKNIFTLTVEE